MRTFAPPFELLSMPEELQRAPSWALGHGLTILYAPLVLTAPRPAKSFRDRQSRLSPLRRQHNESMEYIYTFVGGSPDFEWLSKHDFRRRFGLPEALGFLKQIRGTLATEAGSHRRPGAFYTGLRHAFAELDGLGKLYAGEYARDNTAANAIKFGTKYLGRVNPRYRSIFGLLFDMYRHGLAHGHLVRTVRYLQDHKWHRIYWSITEDTTDHLGLHTSGPATWLVVSIPQLVDDTIAALDEFSGDLGRKGPESKLLDRFKKGYISSSLWV